MSWTMRSVLVLVALFAVAQAWGYWHLSTHANLHIQVDDYGLKTDRQLYGSPHGTKLALYGDAGELLARASSVEPLGYILALHPTVGNCTAVEAGVIRGASSQQDYAHCYDQYSRWAATWAARARTATVEVGDCRIQEVPIILSNSISGWWYWWLPLRHIGGAPYRDVDLRLRVNSQSCRSAEGQV